MERSTRISYEEHAGDVTVTGWPRYRITHTYQMQEDEDTNIGQYTDVVETSSWEWITDVIDNMLRFPETGGFTVSIHVDVIPD
jgi:hypothetical protein